MCIRDRLFISGGKERITRCLAEDKATKKNIKFIEELHKCKSEYYRSILLGSDISLRPGVKRLITEAKEKNIKIGIATNSSTENLQALIKKTFKVEPEKLFNTIVTNNIIADKKPSPEVYYRALKNLELSANKCIAVEDTVNGNTSAISCLLYTSPSPRD